MAEHAEEMNDYLIKELNLTPLECNELWSFVKKRKLSVMAEINLKKVMRGSIHA